MRFAISIPQYARERFDAAGFRAHLQRAEELGFESGWVQEQVLGSAGALAPLETMTYAAACSERLRLGCAVFVFPLHNPLHLAKAISSIDCLSHGRLEVGLVAGGAFRPFTAFGIHPEVPVARFNEGVALMKACWAEPQINFDGRFWKLEGAAMEPKPVQQPHPPLWLGGNHPNALKRAVRLGDGFIGAGSQSTAAFTEQVQAIRDELASQKRDPASFQIAKRLYIHLGDDADRAREQIEGALADHYGRSVPGVAVAGPAEACIEAVLEVAHAGAELILLNTLVDDAEQMERLAAEVIPAVRESARSSFRG